MLEGRERKRHAKRTLINYTLSLTNLQLSALNPGSPLSFWDQSSHESNQTEAKERYGSCGGNGNLRGGSESGRWGREDAGVTLPAGG